MTHAVALSCFARSLAVFDGNGRLSRPQGIAIQPNEAAVGVSDERTLLQRAKASDQAAFTALYDRHAALVYGICKRILRDATQAEDVTQSVFTGLWVKPDAFVGGNFAAWISRVARNAALDVVRSAAVRTREPQMPEDVPAETDLEEEVFQRVQLSTIAQALQALPADQREAIEQAYFQGFSYREVAQRTGAPLGTIKSRIRTGLRRLWEALQQQVVP